MLTSHCRYDGNLALYVAFVSMLALETAMFAQLGQNTHRKRSG